MSNKMFEIVHNICFVYFTFHITNIINKNVEIYFIAHDAKDVV